MNWLLVFLGGGLGSVLRYGISKYYSELQPASVFPWATMTSNIISCFIAGLVFALLSKQTISQEYKWLLIVGFCGGFSTFSAFSYETLNMVQQHQWIEALMYTLASIFLGLLSLYLGLKVVTFTHG